MADAGGAAAGAAAAVAAAGGGHGADGTADGRALAVAPPSSAADAGGSSDRLSRLSSGSLRMRRRPPPLRVEVKAPAWRPAVSGSAATPPPLDEPAGHVGPPAGVSGAGDADDDEPPSINLVEWLGCGSPRRAPPAAAAATAAAPERWLSASASGEDPSAKLLMERVVAHVALSAALHPLRGHDGDGGARLRRHLQGTAQALL
ncbi:hypothetical protein I4F81_008243 [Pyropia yezoensis]|uniref:Uncharacterized protein n=1 Tax=Pyropia yezoensis TaxID=2788 RepID=A0ACC3C6N4_PYRYE|nr:hypothetical protein I4F81_008243 [Neopyropia yezoensis]